MSAKRDRHVRALYRRILAATTLEPDEDRELHARRIVRTVLASRGAAVSDPALRRIVQPRTRRRVIA